MKEWKEEYFKKAIEFKQKELILKLIESKGIDPECTNNINDNQNFDLNIIKKIFTSNKTNIC